jgi:hypothetical protein
MEMNMKWAVAAVLGSVMSMTAPAQSPPDFATCARLGQVARSIAQDRDRGVPYQERVRGLDQALARVPDERAVMLRLAKSIYDIPSMTPEGAYKLATAPCTARRRR